MLERGGRRLPDLSLKVSGGIASILAGKGRFGRFIWKACLFLCLKTTEDWCAHEGSDRQE